MPTDTQPTPEDPANPDYGNQEAFNRFVDQDSIRLLDDDAGHSSWVISMHPTERMIKWRGLKMPTNLANKLSEPDEFTYTTPITADEEDLIIKALNMPPIRDEARNAGLRKRVR